MCHHGIVHTHKYIFEGQYRYHKRSNERNQLNVILCVCVIYLESSIPTVANPKSEYNVDVSTFYVLSIYVIATGKQYYLENGKEKTDDHRRKQIDRIPKKKNKTQKSNNVSLSHTHSHTYIYTHTHTHCYSYRPKMPEELNLSMIIGLDTVVGWMFSIACTHIRRHTNIISISMQILRENKKKVI